MNEKVKKYSSYILVVILTAFCFFGIGRCSVQAGGSFIGGDRAGPDSVTSGIGNSIELARGIEGGLGAVDDSNKRIREQLIFSNARIRELETRLGSINETNEGIKLAISRSIERSRATAEKTEQLRIIIRNLQEINDRACNIDGLSRNPIGNTAN
jgi:hypothetical protein